jgi:hypothetical protein
VMTFTVYILNRQRIGVCRTAFHKLLLNLGAA